MRRQDVVLGEHYYLRTMYGGELGDRWGGTEVIAISATPEDTYKLWGYVRREQRGVRVQSVNDPSGTTRVVATRDLLGTWQQHLDTHKRHAEEQAEREALQASIRERLLDINEGLKSRNLPTVYVSPYSSSSFVDLPLKTVEALLGLGDREPTNA